MAVGNDPTASGGRFVSSTVAESGTVKFVVTLAATNYVIWCLHRSTGPASDSFYVSMDGTEDRYNTAPGDTQGPNWQWGRVNGVTANVDPRVFSVSQGTHTLIFRGREANCALDKIIITADPAFVPPPPQAPPIQPPLAPQNFRAVMVTTTQITLAWSMVHPESVEVERAEQANPFAKISTAAPGTLSYIDTRIRRHRDYAYRLRSINGSGVSGYSNTLLFETR